MTTNKTIICNCNQVSELEIRNINCRNNSNNLADVQLITHAGTRCGRCLASVKSIVNEEFNNRMTTQLKLF